jgi:hypothetical protein
VVKVRERVIAKARGGNVDCGHGDGQTHERASPDVDFDHRPAGLARPSILCAAEQHPRRGRLRPVRGGAVSAVLRADDGPAQPAAGAVFPVAAARILRRARLGAWHRLAGGRFARRAPLRGARPRRRGTRSFHDLAHAAVNRRGDHRAVFTWVQERLVTAGLLTGRTVAIDATTLEANAAMRSIVRRDTGERYQEFLTRLAAASGPQDADPRGLGAPGPAPEEAHVKPGVEEPLRSGREDHEDEGRADASGAQGRARRGSRQWRARGGDAAGRRCRGHHESRSRRPASPRNRSRPRTLRA